MERTKKYFLLSVVSILVLAIGTTLAYFTVRIEGEGKTISVDTANLRIIYTDTKVISASNIKPGELNETKTFTIKNESDGVYNYNIVIKDFINTFVTNGYLQYKLESSDGGYNMSEFRDLTKSLNAKDEVLVHNYSIAKDATHTYTLTLVYTNDENVDQSDDMGKNLYGHIEIEKGTEPTLVYQLLQDKYGRDSRNDFSVVYTTENTNKLFTTQNTEDGSNVYYFAGNAKNNWVKFGKYAVDSTLWVGYNSSGASPRDYIEYTYSTESACTSSSYNNNCHKLYSAGDDMYWRIIRTNEEIEGGGVRLLYAGTSPDTKDGYIDISIYNSVGNDPTYVGYKNGTTGNTTAMDRTNTNSSTIKGVIDSWYVANLKAAGTTYDNHVNTKAIYCNDRSINSKYNYLTDYNKDMYFASYERLGNYVGYGGANYNPSYACGVTKDGFGSYFANESDANRKLDKFSADSIVGNGELADAPAALITADEIAFAGGKYDTANATTWYYLNAASTPGSITNNRNWWTMSPYNGRIGNSSANVWFIAGSGRLGRLWDSLNNQGISTYLRAVRPVISLNANVIVEGGTGEPTNPYTIKLSD